MADMGDDSVPEEIEEPCMQCHHSLSGIEQMLRPVLAVGRAQTEQQLDSLDAASLILLLTYTMNSLFWVYLGTQGINPKTHMVKRELERVQQAMLRAKTISGRRKAGGQVLNTGVAKRFIRSALWEEGRLPLRFLERNVTFESPAEVGEVILLLLRAFRGGGEQSRKRKRPEKGEKGEEGEVTGAKRPA